MDLHSFFQFDDGAKEFRPRRHVDKNSEGMSWKLLSVSKPAREAVDTRSPSSPDSGVLLAVGIRETLTLRGRGTLELLVQTLHGDTVCEMSAHEDGYGSVKMTNGYLVIEDPSLQGWRIASYCFNHLAIWAKRRYSDRNLSPIKLEIGDAQSQTNRVRRNRFYEQFGIEFDYADKDGMRHAIGESKPMKIGALIERSWDCFPNICELDVRDTFAVAALLFPQAQRRVTDLLGCVSAAMRETRASRRFFRGLRYLNWINYAVCVWLGAMAMTALSRLS